MVRLDGLCRSDDRGASWAVRDLSLKVNSGEIYGFLGPNGAGKTTTLRMMAGLLPPTRGQVRLAGIDVWQEPLRAKRIIGFLPDNPDIYERLTGLEYIRFIADVFQVPGPARAERSAYLLDLFEMKEAAGDLISSYSHGMRQKIALIAALVHQPKILILDEPMVGLDPRSAHLFKQLLRRHCDQGGTVFFSTHILDVAERLCDRVGIIQKGRLIAEGTLAELKAGQAENATLESLFLELTAKGEEGQE